MISIIIDRTATNISSLIFTWPHLLSVTSEENLHSLFMLWSLFLVLAELDPTTHLVTNVTLGPKWSTKAACLE